MADDHVSLDLDEPVALRRKRRSSAAPDHSQTSSNVSVVVYENESMSTPPATPRHDFGSRRSKKRVRFSDPGPSIDTDFTSSGLTPNLRRTSLGSVKRRRHSMPVTVQNRATSPVSGEIQFAPLRQVLDGRVKRRLRRNRLSEEVNTIQWEKRMEAKRRRSEVLRLKEQLKGKDLQMQEMRDEHDLASQLGNTSSVDGMSTKVQDLEQQIENLKKELGDKDANGAHGEHDATDWTMAGHDPFGSDNDVMNDDYDDNDFGMSMMDDEVMTTPTRLKTSFLSPPGTAPNTPSGPPSVGVQTSPRLDSENQELREQLRVLQTELEELRSTVALRKDRDTRLSQKLTSYLPTPHNTPVIHDYSSLDSALDSVLTQLALSQALALEHGSSFSVLSSEICALGFSTAVSPVDTLAVIAAQFRSARLELEYLMPGEVAEGFENEKLLKMLLGRIRVLLDDARKRDVQIDEYHAQEVALRREINAGVEAMDGVQRELLLAAEREEGLTRELEEKETSCERHRDALDDYRREVLGLEELVEKMEEEALEKQGQREEWETEKEAETEELQERLGNALEAAEELRGALLAKESELADRADRADELWERDARITDLEVKIDTLSQALQDAREMIDDLRAENSTLAAQNQDLETQVQSERSRGHAVVRGMREQLSHVLSASQEYLSSPLSAEPVLPELPTPMSSAEVVVRKGGIFDKKQARRSSGNTLRVGGEGMSVLPEKRKRRRWDSGLGFLEEDEGEGSAGLGGDGLSSDY